MSNRIEIAKGITDFLFSNGDTETTHGTFKGEHIILGAEKTPISDTTMTVPIPSMDEYKEYLETTRWDEI